MMAHLEHSTLSPEPLFSPSPCPSPPAAPSPAGETSSSFIEGTQQVAGCSGWKKVLWLADSMRWRVSYLASWDAGKQHSNGGKDSDAELTGDVMSCVLTAHCCSLPVHMKVIYFAFLLLSRVET
jgi:hypothetical protein